MGNGNPLLTLFQHFFQWLLRILYNIIGIGILKQIIIRKMAEHLKFIKNMPNHNFEDFVCDELTKLDLKDLIHLLSL